MPRLVTFWAKIKILVVFVTLLLNSITAMAQDGGLEDTAPQAPAPTATVDSGTASDDGKNPAPLRFALAAGPTIVTGAERSFGARVALGADLYLDPSHLYFLNFMISKPFVSERMGGRHSGIINRTYFLPGIGMYFVPERIWGRINAGLGYLTSSNPDVVAKLKPSYALGLGYKQPIDKNWDWGVELGFEYSGRAQKSIAFLYDDLSCALGDCEASGTIPRGIIWSLNLVLGYAL